MILINEKEIFDYGSKKLLVNYLTGACDIINSDVANIINNPNKINDKCEFKEELMRRGYIFENEEEYAQFIKTLDNQINEIEKKTAPNFLLIPSYNCNLKCSYCFEQKYDHTKSSKIDNWISYAFQFIDNQVKHFCDYNRLNVLPKDIIITLMGGEPLLIENLRDIEEIIDKLEQRGYSYNIITNGYHVEHFISIFSKYKPQAIQITLDGTKEIHDSRRMNKLGEGSFDKIVSNIHYLIDMKILVHIRMNIDRSNINSLKEFCDKLDSEFGDSKYLKYYIYPIQDGGCLAEDIIIDEVECIKAINTIKSCNIKTNKVHCVFHGSSFIDSVIKNSPIKFKSRNCAANKSQYILDSMGNVYKCWFGVGNEKFSIGSYYKENGLNENKDKVWKNRTTSNISKCSKCKYRYICGGGCLSHVYNQDKDILNPRCIDYHNILKEQFRSIIKSGEN